MGSSSCSCSYATPISSEISFRRYFDGVRLPRTLKNARKARQRATKLLAGLSPDHLQELVSPAMDHLFFAYERVVMPCHNMNCGDVVHRRWASLITWLSLVHTKRVQASLHHRSGLSLYVYSQSHVPCMAIVVHSWSAVMSG